MCIEIVIFDAEQASIKTYVFWWLLPLERSSWDGDLANSGTDFKKNRLFRSAAITSIQKSNGNFVGSNHTPNYCHMRVMICNGMMLRG